MYNYRVEYNGSKLNLGTSWPLNACIRPSAISGSDIRERFFVE